jgi:two-component system LytT family response regulator
MRFFKRQHTFKIDRYMVWRVIIVLAAIALVLTVIGWFNNSIRKASHYSGDTSGYNNPKNTNMNTNQLNTDYLKLSVTEGVFIINPSDIIRLKASSNYTFIYFTNRRMLVIAKVLKQFEDALRGHGFIRTHRTHLINRRHVNSISGDGHIIMTDATVAGISKRMKSQVMKQLCPAA